MFNPRGPVDRETSDPNNTPDHHDVALTSPVTCKAFIWRFITYLWIPFLPGVKTVATFFYVWIVLISTHWVYLGYMEDIQEARSCRLSPRRGYNTARLQSRAETRSAWASLMGEMTRTCFLTFGVYIAQNSSEVLPRMLGHILIVVSADGIMNSVAILMLTSVNMRMTNRYMSRLSKSALVKLAKIFAIPISTLLWSLLLTAISALSYIHQSDVPELQTPTFERQDHHREAQEYVPDVPQNTDQVPLQTLAPKPPLPQAAVIALGNLIVLNILRLIWVIRGLVSIRRSPSVVQVREPARRQVSASTTELRNDAATLEGTTALTEARAPATPLDNPRPCRSTAVVVMSTYMNGSVTSEPEQLSNSDRERPASPVLSKRSKQTRHVDITAGSSLLARQNPEEPFAGQRRAHEISRVSIIRTCTTSRSSSNPSTWSTSSSITQYA